jgi:hypothetical protein
MVMMNYLFVSGFALNDCEQIVAQNETTDPLRGRFPVNTDLKKDRH